MEMYQKIIEDFIVVLKISECRVCFQQDNVQPHVARDTFVTKREKTAKLLKKSILIFFHFLGHKGVYFQMVYEEKILVDHIRLSKGLKMR